MMYRNHPTADNEHPGGVLTIVDRLAAYRPAAIKNLSARARLCTIAAAIVTALVLTGVLGSLHPGGPPDSGLAGCASLSSTHHVAASGYRKIRARFVGSRWPDLRTAGAAYTDLAVQLRHARYTDGYETVWFYQRLSAACAKHGRPLNADS
jgi:hypothetical protein